MKKTKLFLFVVICSLSIAAVASNVFALTYYSNPFGYKYATLNIDTFTYLSAPYFSNTVNAVNSWNSCNLSRNISTSTSNPNKIRQSAEIETWFGLYEPLETDTSGAQTRSYITTKFKITLNTTELSSENDFAKQATACHELGHAFGLAHNDDADPGKTIMRSSSLTVNTPQTYDKNAVDYLWPNW